MTTKTQTRPVSYGLPGDSGWHCACDCKAHLTEVDCQPLNAPASGKYCPACAQAVEVGLIRTLGTLIRDAVAYDGSDRDLDNLRKVYALRTADDARWIDFLKLWIEQTPSTRAAGGAEQILRFHTEHASATALDNFRAHQAEKAPKLTMPESDGMYRNPQTGEIFKVQVAVHGSGKLYAKQMVGWTRTPDLDSAEAEKVTSFQLEGKQIPMDIEFQYVSGAIRKIDASWKMSLEEAKAFGALYGTCCVCGRTLTDEKSIAAGIGPICAGKF